MKTSTLALTLALSAFAFTPALADEAPKVARTSDNTAAVSTSVGEGGAVAAQPQARRVCRAQGATGTRVPGPKLCLTKAEWRRLDRGESITIMEPKGASRR